MKLNGNFLVGGRVQSKKPSMGGVSIFSGSAHSNINTHYLLLLFLFPYFSC